MSATIPDVLFSRLQELADCLDVTLTRYGQPVCRTYIAPGGPPAWDVCCDCGIGEGSAWVQVARVFPTDNFPTQLTQAVRCRPGEFAAVINVGVLRCAATIDDNAEIPSAERLTADALKVQTDRVAIYDAFTCCFMEDKEPGTNVIGAWTPLGPSGGCVGSSVEFTINFPNCRCP